MGVSGSEGCACRGYEIAATDLLQHVPLLGQQRHGAAFQGGHVGAGFANRSGKSVCMGAILII
jgi:hypothetical protein